MSKLSCFLLCVCLASCNAACSLSDARTQPARSKRPQPDASAAPVADAYGEAQLIGTISDPQLNEISGLAPSHSAKGLWWAHNDSGDQARLYVINSAGKKLGQFIVAGAKNRDWEDMASYIGKDGQAMLLIADSGNNGATQEELTLYRLKEPNLAKSKSGETEPAEVFTFRYPDGKFDAEALFVDPASGRPYLVTKTNKPPCAIYRFPLPLRAGQTMTLEKVKGAATQRVGQLLMTTGAAASPDGNRVVVRTYFTALELMRAKGGGFETIFSSEPETIKIPLERQGEAISYTADGKALVTTSEGVPAPFYQLPRQPITQK
jgi:hypothetical protein